MRAIPSSTVSTASCFNAALALEHKEGCMFQIPVWIPIPPNHGSMKYRFWLFALYSYRNILWSKYTISNYRIAGYNYFGEKIPRMHRSTLLLVNWNISCFNHLQSSITSVSLTISWRASSDSDYEVNVSYSAWTLRQINTVQRFSKYDVYFPTNYFTVFYLSWLCTHLPPRFLVGHHVSPDIVSLRISLVTYAVCQWSVTDWL